MALGRTALRLGRLDEARRWLDRGWRLAPGDAAVGLLLASVILDADPARAQRVLRQILAAHPGLRDGRIGLAGALFRSGEHEAAASLLAETLREAAASRTPHFRSFADAVCAAVGATGWAGVDSAGRLVVSMAASPKAAAIDIDLDGRRRRLPQPRRHGVHALPRDGRRALRLRVMADGRELLGSPIDLAALRRIEGVVRADPDGGISGCAWLPGDPDAAPVLTLVCGDARRSWRLAAAPGGVAGASPLARGFRVAPARLPSGVFKGGLRVLDPEGRDLPGSPLLYDQRPASRVRPRRALRPGPGRPVDIVIPVHRGVADLAACLGGLRRGLPEDARIVVVDDASHDPALDEFLADLEQGAAVVLRQARHRGFPAAANAGLRHAKMGPGQFRNVLLLNPDTVPPPGLVARLAAAANAALDIGSVTAMTCDGTIVSCDAGVAASAWPPAQAEMDRIDGWFAAANGDTCVELPTGVGFCMFIRHDCLADVGLFREDLFAQGYGEENDWCARGRRRGWRHVAATGIFVAHAGGRSFGGRRTLLMERNQAVLARLHPNYEAEVATFVRSDPLRDARRRAAAARWAASRSPRDAVILVTHDLGGGTDRRVAFRSDELAAQGLRPIVLRLDPAGFCRIAGHGFADLRTRLPDELAKLAELLRGDRPRWLELHHLAGLPPHLLALADQLGIPYDIVVHDYALACPRVTFCGADGRYCGEPADLAECAGCIAAHGSRLHETITVAELRARSGRILGGARQVLVPCEDVARRMRRYFPAVTPVVTPWEPPAPASVTPGDEADARRVGGDTRVCLVGALGQDKGYDILLACAQDAERRRLPLSFVVVGHTVDDARLLATGRVFVTGRFEEAEAVPLIRAQRAQLGLVASVCPETWSYALSAIWRAGLPAAAFALGAPAERIARSGRGWVIPLGASVSRINALLLERGASNPAEPA